MPELHFKGKRETGVLVGKEHVPGGVGVWCQDTGVTQCPLRKGGDTTDCCRAWGVGGLLPSEAGEMAWGQVVLGVTSSAEGSVFDLREAGSHGSLLKRVMTRSLFRDAQGGLE